MAADQLSQQQTFELGQYAEALSTLASALSSLVSDDLITVPEARGILFRCDVLSVEMMKEIDAQQHTT